MNESCSIPMPVLVVIDDVGWWKGYDDSLTGGPYRTGVPRMHTWRDYEGLARMGKALGIRVQAAFVLGEWDTYEIVKKVRGTRSFYSGGGNDFVKHEEIEKAADILSKEREHIEIALHGICHEYWLSESEFERAEFYDKEGNLRAKDVIRQHLDAFGEMMHRSGLGLFPQSFVPPAFLYRYDESQHGLSTILKEYGIKYLSSPFASMFNKPKGFCAVENGIITLDRNIDFLKWNKMASCPDTIRGGILGAHWAAFIHMDPNKNLSVIEQWIKYLKRYKEQFDLYLAKNTMEAFSQAYYKQNTVLRQERGKIVVDVIMPPKKIDGLLDYFYINLKNKAVLWEGFKAQRVEQCSGFARYKFFVRNS